MKLIPIKKISLNIEFEKNFQPIKDYTAKRRCTKNILFKFNPFPKNFILPVTQSNLNYLNTFTIYNNFTFILYYKCEMVKTKF